MIITPKHEKILAAAASFGAHSDLYWNEAKELEKAGLIELKETITKAGARRVNRWFLVKPKM